GQAGTVTITLGASDGTSTALDTLSLTVACAAGTYLNGSTCSTCAAGTYSAAGATSCTACGAGTYSAAGAGSCTAWSTCAAGTFVNNTPSATVNRTCAACGAN